jgi:xanthine/uracil permease
MDWIGKLNVVLGVICVIIGLLLVPIGGWFLKNAIINKDTASYVVAAIILIFAILIFIGAFNILTSGLINFSSYMDWLK